MKRFSILHIPVWSFFSRRLYCDVALRWRGTNFGYLLLLLVVVWIPVMVGMQATLSRFLEEKGPEIVAQVPHFSLRDGKASITEPQPYTIKDPETDEPFLIIDTTGKITSLDDTPAKMLVTETEMIFQKNPQETQTTSFQDMEDFTFGPDEFKSWLDTIGRYAALVLYPLAVIGSYIYRVVQALIYGLIGLMLASIVGIKIGYSASLRLAVVAVTPCILINTILGITGIQLPLAALWYFLITVAYLWYGIAAVAQAEPPLTAETLETSEDGNEGAAE